MAKSPTGGDNGSQQQRKCGEGFSRGFLLSKSKGNQRGNASAKPRPRTSEGGARPTESSHKENKASKMRRGFLLAAPSSQKKECAATFNEVAPRKVTNSGPMKTRAPCDATGSPKKNAKTNPVDPDRSSKAKTVSSSALLDLEETTGKSGNHQQSNNQASSLLFVSGGDDNQSNPKPLNPIVMLDNNKDDQGSSTVNEDSLGLTEISSSTIRRKKGTLISEFENNIDDKSSRPSRAKHETKAENSTLPSDEVLLGGSTNQDCEETISTGPLEQQPKTSPREQTDFIKCQRALDRVLWHIRRKAKRGSDKEWKPVAMEFSSNVMERQKLIPWIWECLMAACPKASTQNLAERRLGLVLLSQTSTTEQWNAFASFLSPSPDKESRVLTLGAVTILEFWVEGNEPFSQPPEWMVDLLSNAIPGLTEQVMTTHSTRTVLAQRASAAIYSLINAAAEYCEENPDRNTSLLQQELWRLSSTSLVPVWDTQLGWNTTKSDDEGNIEGRRSSARKNCISAVLRDWKRSADALLQGQNDDAAPKWYRALTGVKVDDEGGATLGSLGQTLLKSKDSKLSAENIVAYLKSATVHSEVNEETDDRQAAILRGVVAWLGQSKKNLSDILYSSEIGSLGKSIHQEVFEACSDMLRYTVSERVVDLSLEALYALWADSYGLPGDLVAICDHDDTTTNDDENTQELPGSLKHWVLLLDGDGEFFIEASREALSTLIAQSIVQLCLGTKAGASLSRLAISYIHERHGMGDATVRVLVTTLKVLQISAAGGYAQSAEQRRKALLDYIGCDLLLENLETSAMVQRAIKREQTLHVDPLSECSIARLVPQQVRLIAKLLQDAGEKSESIRILAISLTAVLRQSLPRGEQDSTIDKQTASNVVVAKVIETLMCLMDENEATSPGPPQEKKKDATGLTNNQQMEKICFQIGETWRRSLLNEAREQLSTHGFGVVISSIGREMFRSPSSIIPLTLFGAVLGDSLSYEDEDIEDSKTDDRYKKKSIYVAVTSLLRVAVGELDGFQDRQADACPSTDGIFGRLAPLLLLRRAPPNFFRAAYKESFPLGSSGDDSLRVVLAQLASHLADRLDIGVVGSRMGYSSEERQMAAELAGRCLPFSGGSSCLLTATEHAPAVDDGKGSPRQDDGEYSFFSRIGMPGFSGMMGFLLDSDRPCDDTAISLIRRARAALYAVCHYIPFAKPNDDKPNGDALLSTASFCLQVLNADLERFEATPAEQDMHQLQAGCIEFFAVCIEKSLIFRCLAKKDSLVTCFQELHDSLLEIVRGVKADGVIQRKWLDTALTDATAPHSQHQKQRKRSFSVPCRTCLWNSLIVVSQRCPEHSEKLGQLTRESLPWLVTWGTYCYDRNPPEHPLCITAAMQFTFILITQTKSFVGLNGFNDVQKLHRWALLAIRESNGLSDYVNNALRCAGLKLLLAIMTIGQIVTDDLTTRGNSDSSDFRGPPLLFSPRDLKETHTALEEIATNDPDPKLQILASHVLGTGLR